MAAPENKLRQMEEEMNRFEAEIAYQTVSSVLPTVSTAPSSGSFAFPSATSFIPHQLRINPQTPTSVAMPSVVPMYVPLSQPTVPAYLPVVPTVSANQLQVPTKPVLPSATVPTDSPGKIVSKTISNETIQKVITAPPQMAGPNELAARAKEAEVTAAKLKAAVDDDDDDVTRALLAAAAGVTYTRIQGPNGKEKVRASITKPPLTPVISQSTVGQKNVIPAPSSDIDRFLATLPPPTAPPAYRVANTNTAAANQYTKKKKYIRIAAGVTWVDPTLAEWDPNDFRIFCGDLGNEMNDDTLARAFSRYASFQKARVVRDKRTGKSRGYGFVSFSDPADFTRAMREMNGKYVGNRPIKLKRSDWRGRQLETHRKKDKERKKLGLKN